MRNKQYFARNKYNAHKAGGFDSEKESRRWQELLLMQKAGAISHLERQVKFELIPAQREPDRTGERGGTIRGKTIERAVTYIADFVYYDKATNKTIVEDVKGYRDSEAYKLYVIKRKLMLWRYGIRIREV